MRGLPLISVATGLRAAPGLPVFHRPIGYQPIRAIRIAPIWRAPSSDRVDGGSGRETVLRSPVIRMPVPI